MKAVTQCIITLPYMRMQHWAVTWVSTLQFMHLQSITAWGTCNLTPQVAIWNLPLQFSHSHCSSAKDDSGWQKPQKGPTTHGACMHVHAGCIST